MRRSRPESALRQCNRLERADDVVRAGLGEEAFVETRSQIPVIALVILVAVKTPDAADHDERADAIVPEIAQVMKAQVGPGVGAFKADVVVNNQLRQAKISLDWLGVPGIGGVGVIAQWPDLPFGVDDRAIIWRQLRLWYLSHKRRLVT